MANAINSILSLQQIPFSCRSSQDKWKIKELGPPRPNINIKQVTLSTKSEKTCIRGFSRSWYERKKGLAGCEVANALFCYLCILFHIESRSDMAWTTTRVTDMHHLLQKVTVKMYKRGAQGWLGKPLNATTTIPYNTHVIFRVSGEEEDLKILANTICSITLSI